MSGTMRAARVPCPHCGKRRDTCAECGEPARIYEHAPDDLEAVHVTEDGAHVIGASHEARIHGGCMASK